MLKTLPRGAGAFLVAACWFSTPLPVHAAEPASGTLSADTPELSYDSGPFLVSNPVGITANGAPDCLDPALPCDDYALTTELSSSYLNPRPTTTLRIAVGWDAAADDYDIFAYDADGAVIAQSSSSANPEVMEIPAASGTQAYTIRIVPYLVSGGSTHAVITLNAPPAGEAPALPEAAAGAPPRFAYFQSPEGLADSAGEPTVGFNPFTQRAMFIAALETDRVSFAESSGALDAAGNPLPASCDPTWEDVSYVGHVNTLDPILQTEQSVGRTFSSQLSGANSLFAYSDDDGESWLPGQIGPPNGGVDHQTVGSGPYAEGFNFGRGVDYAVYYCSQSVAAAFCARSDDGGVTFGPGIPMFVPGADCDGLPIGALHGHVQVGPDGTVYVPFGGCGSKQAVSVSEDSGLTWTVKQVPLTEPGDDPGMGIAKDGTAYFCYINGTGSPHVTVSTDKGESWTSDYDIGARAGIRHAVFPTAVAGDGDRAACAFLGTQEDGNTEALDFPGVWHPYVAVTYDRGQTWHTVNVAPHDPVQGAGGICLSGTTCGSNRNLLDFNDIIIDDHGRVLFAHADGCVGNCVLDPSKNSFTDNGVIARLQGGRPLFAEFDPVEPAAPVGACAAGTRTGKAAQLQWTAGDDGGSPISGYDIYRGTRPDAVTEKIGSTGGKTAFEDRSTSPTVENYYYQVVAKNAQGSTPGNVIALPLSPEPLPESSCALPGITATVGSAGDCTTNGCTPQTDLIKASVAELPSLPEQIVFDIEVDSLDPLPLPGNYWLLLTTTQSGENLFLSMDTATGTPAFNYGSYVAGTAGLLTFTPAGSLHEASTWTTDGHIYLVADRALFGDLKAGDVISPIDVRTRTGADVVPSRDTLPNGDYVVQGIKACANNAAPLALLGVDKQFGEAPLNVTFSVSGGVGTPGTELDGYVLDFGDGNQTEGSFAGNDSLSVDHSYAANGNFPARLTITDSEGTASENRAERVIQVGEKAAGSGNADQGRFGGSLGLALLLPLTLLALLRRRRH